MSISPRLIHELKQVLGTDAAEDLVTWMERNDDIHEDISAMRGDLKASVAELRTEVQANIAELRHEMQVGFARLETLVESRTADLMKWSFVFWVGAVAAIAMLAGVLR
jgi:hypothetical protein